MAILSSTIKDLCDAGCNVIVNFGDYQSSILKDLAQRANLSDGHLTIKNCQTALPSTLKSIGAVGRSSVTFDFTN